MRIWRRGMLVLLSREICTLSMKEGEDLRILLLREVIRLTWREERSRVVPETLSRLFRWPYTLMSSIVSLYSYWLARFLLFSFTHQQLTLNYLSLPTSIFPNLFQITFQVPDVKRDLNHLRDQDLDVLRLLLLLKNLRIVTQHATISMRILLPPHRLHLHRLGANFHHALHYPFSFLQWC